MPSCVAEEDLLRRSEPQISVGLLTEAECVRFVLTGEFRTREGKLLPGGEYQAVPLEQEKTLVLIHGRTAQGEVREITSGLTLIPTDPATATFAIHDVPVGKGFHWERKQTPRYAGVLKISLAAAISTAPRLTVVNELPLETYLMSVIASEMNARAPLEFLKAHAIVSRSWLLANRARRGQEESPAVAISVSSAQAEEEILRWTDRTAHREFDVCAEDHCQRYYGLTPIVTEEISRAVRETRGQVLRFGQEICDARFSKCCGGALEDYRSAWEDREVPYLRGGRFDGEQWPHEFPHPLTEEAHAVTWILGFPPAYCHVTEAHGLTDVLSDVDLLTRDFFRWEYVLSQEELQALIRARLGRDLGAIRRLEPLQRGTSGRIVRLRLVGERRSLVLGKELEIRRALSWTHLYSSAFVVFPEEERAGIPRRFRLRGAGWGHGVGLCQIGAALMAKYGKTHREILAHYYAPAEVVSLYE